jgi:DNA-directed RNA polymerase specialized sigma24 family protein
MARAMVAVRMRDLEAALGRLEPPRRALLDLSVRRGLSDADIAELLRVDPGEVGRRRKEIFDRLAGDLGLDGMEERDELYATLPDLPDELWSGRVDQAARA